MVVNLPRALPRARLAQREICATRASESLAPTSTGADSATRKAIRSGSLVRSCSHAKKKCTPVASVTSDASTLDMAICAPVVAMPGMTTGTATAAHPSSVAGRRTTHVQVRCITLCTRRRAVMASRPSVRNLGWVLTGGS